MYTKEAETKNNGKPRIYVACLAAYNAGQLHGGWINCDVSAEEIGKAVKEILQYSPQAKYQACVEWAIHDCEGFGGITLSESESFETVAELAEAISKEGEAFATFYDCNTYDSVEDALEKFSENYLGEFETEKDFAEEQLNENGTIEAVKEAGLAAYYIDFEAVARDWFCGDYWSSQAPGGRVYVYSYY